MHIKRILLTLFMIGVIAHQVYSATTTGTLNVTCTVVAQCSVTAAPLTFGNYDPTSSTPLDQTTTLTVNCSKNQPYTLSSNAGNGVGATLTNRIMTLSSNQATYQIFRDSNRTEVFGNPTVTPGTYTIAGTGNGLLTANTHTIYGRMAINQDIPPGTYSDVITVTVTY